MKKISKIFLIMLFLLMLVACQNTQKFNVVFDANGGSPTPASQEVDKGGFVREPIDPVGETAFLYWYSEELDLIWNFKEHQVEGNLTLKAQYEEEVINTYYDVIFDYGIDDIVADTVKVLANGKVDRPVDPQNQNYQFLGWYLNDNHYDFNTPVTTNIKLTAKWQEIVTETYIVTFNYGIANQDDLDVVVDVGNKVLEPTAPTLNGYQFLGWYLEDELYNFEQVVNNNLELVAKFSEVKLTLTLPSSVSASITNLTNITYNVEITLTVNVPNGKQISQFRVNDHFVSGNQYTFNIVKNTVVIVEFSDLIEDEITYTEDFSLLAAWKASQGYNSSEYLDYTYTGSNSFEFDLLNARVDLGMVQGDQGITLGGFGNEYGEQGRGWIMLEDFKDGLSSLKFEARLPFSPESSYPQGPGSDTARIVYISVYVNDERIARLQFTDNRSANRGQVFEINDLNYQGDTTFRIEVSSGHRLTIGSLSWTTNLYGSEDESKTLLIDFDNNNFEFDREPATYDFNGVAFVLKEVQAAIMHGEKESPYMTAENGLKVARFRGNSTHWASTPIAYMYNQDPFAYLSKISFDAKEFGSDGYFAPDAVINIYIKLNGEEEFTLIKTIDDLDTHLYKNFEVAIDQSNVIVKIEVVGGTLNIDNIIFAYEGGE